SLSAGRRSRLVRQRVLIVEDERSIGEVEQAVLTDEGYDAIIATTGSDALALAQAFAPDVVVLDLDLPDMPGTVVADRIAPRVPIVVASANAAGYAVALRIGAAGYLMKPFHLDA